LRYYVTVMFWGPPSFEVQEEYLNGTLGDAKLSITRAELTLISQVNQKKQVWPLASFKRYRWNSKEITFQFTEGNPLIVKSKETDKIAALFQENVDYAMINRTSTGSKPSVDRI